MRVYSRVFDTKDDLQCFLLLMFSHYDANVELISVRKENEYYVVVWKANFVLSF